MVERLDLRVLRGAVAITFRQPLKKIVDSLGKLEKCGPDFRHLVLDLGQPRLVPVEDIDYPISVLVVPRGKVLHPILSLTQAAPCTSANSVSLSSLASMRSIRS